MRIEIDVMMEYHLGGDDMVLLTLEACQTHNQRIVESSLEIDDGTVHRIGDPGALNHRVWAQVPRDTMNLSYHARVDVDRPAVVLNDLPATPTSVLTPDVLDYLRPSRFCQSDLFTSFVAKTFGGLNGGTKIAAIQDWVKHELSYVPGRSTGMTTAMDTFVAREGVCRDFTHVMCALARAGGVPARYTSVYCADVNPPDFHAVVEVWLDGAWHLIDPTGMSAAPGLVVIASGRDATDVAFMETEKWAYMLRQSVTVSRLD